MTKPAPNLTEEQQIIADSVRRFLQDNYAFDQRQKHVTSDAGFSKEHWLTFAELGWLGLPFSEDVGGFGGSIKEAGLITGLFGEHLVMTPYLTSVIACGTLLAQLSPGRLEQVIDGSETYTCPYFDLENMVIEAKEKDRGYQLTGSLQFLPYGEHSDHILVPAQVAGDWALFSCATSAAGVEHTSYKTYDGGRASAVALINAPAELLAGDALAAMTAADEAVIAMLCTEASAIMWAIEEQTLAYLQTREQFGQTLSSFQALQHRLVDLYVDCQLAQSMAEDAVTAVADQSHDSAKRVTAAKAYIGDLGRKVGQEGVQLHGGIGMTNDLPIGHYLKRLTAIDRIYGDSVWHRNAFRNLVDKES